MYTYTFRLLISPSDYRFDHLEIYQVYWSFCPIFSESFILFRIKVSLYYSECKFFPQLLIKPNIMQSYALYIPACRAHIIITRLLFYY